MSLIKKNLPPLRLILTTRCNGICPFCHHEGTTDVQDMPRELISLYAREASAQHIPSISLTGGEPTIRDDLSEIIQEIQSLHSDGKISLTTNGFRLLHHAQNQQKAIDTLNLSIISLNNRVARNYQTVEPDLALESFDVFPAIHKNLNVVIVKENYLEIENILSYCESQKIHLDLMFELKQYTSYDYHMQRHVLKVLEGCGNFNLHVGSTPSVVINTPNTRIRLKHPYLNSLIHRKMCANCLHYANCFEKACAIRISPNGLISPCLNQYKRSSSLKDAYNHFSEENPFLGFFPETINY